MKYHRFWMIALICLCCLGVLAGCASQEPVTIDPRIPQLDEEEMTTPLGEDGKGLTPREIKTVTDHLLKEEYGIDDLSVYGFEVFYSKRQDQYSVTYRLYIQGYRTYEEYVVVIDAKGKPVSFRALHQGEYSRYLGGATEERMAAAVADIEKKASAYDEQGPYWLEIDSEGYLCLCLELIVEIPYNENVACGDHKHVFFRSRVCGPDQ